jgi:hypothetical protein
MKKIIVSSIALVALIASCKKTAGPAGADGAQGPQGNTGPVLSGSLKGYIYHYDISGAKVTTDLSGDSVYISGNPAGVATDVNGSYTFNGVTTGVYDITVKKAGSNYGWTKIQNIEFAGNGDTYRNAAMSVTPSNSISTIMAYDTTINSVNYIRIKGTLPSSTRAQSLILFVGTNGDSTPTSTNYISNYIVNVAANVAVFAKNIPATDLYDLGYTSGNTAYCAAYTIGSNTNASVYIDFSTNRAIYTAISSGYLTTSAPIQ